MNICSMCVEQSKTNFYLEIIIDFQEIDGTCMGEFIQDWLLQESWIFVSKIYIQCWRWFWNEKRS